MHCVRVCMLTIGVHRCGVCVKACMLMPPSSKIIVSVCMLTVGTNNINRHCVGVS